MSCVTLLLAIALVVVAVYSIVSYERGTGSTTGMDTNITNHLEAGKLQIGLKRVKLETTFLVEDGSLGTSTDNTPADFTDSTDENVFGLGNGKFIVPGNSYKATLEVSNRGDVTFMYWLELKLEGDTVVFDSEFAQKLTLKVTAGGKTVKECLLSELNKNAPLAFGNIESPIGTLAPGAESADLFTMEISFDKNADNNAQTKHVCFDLIVHAVQKV